MLLFTDTAAYCSLCAASAILVVFCRCVQSTNLCREPQRPQLPAAFRAVTAGDPAPNPSRATDWSLNVSFFLHKLEQLAGFKHEIMVRKILDFFTIETLSGKKEKKRKKWKKGGKNEKEKIKKGKKEKKGKIERGKY